MRTRGINGQGAPRTTRLASAVATAAMFFMPLASASMLGDFDAREGSVEPSSQQLGMVSSMGAKASWNDLGTPSSLINYGGYLATDLQGPDATTVARNWVNANKALFRLSSVDSLQMMSDEAFPYSDAYAVTFRQEIGGLRTAEEGLLTVGIVGNAADGWKIAYVSATTTGDAALSGGIAMTAADAYIRAAQNIGAGVQLSDITTTKADGEWTIFSVSGIENEQRVRLRALATPNNGVRPVYETIYMKNASTAPQAYVHYIDAENGTVWMRKDIVEHYDDVDTYDGTMAGVADGACAAPHGPFAIPAGESVGSIAASVIAHLTVNDSTINIRVDAPNGPIIASQDTGFSPEVAVYTGAPIDGAKDVWVEVCDYGDGATWDFPETYSGQIIFSSAEAPSGGLPYPPKWKVFPANPEYRVNADTRDLWCWDNLDTNGAPLDPNAQLDPNCALEVINDASRVPWDYDVVTNAPTFTSKGNNAISSEAWISPLTPGGTYSGAGDPVVSLDRQYDPLWTNSWERNQCSQAAFSPTENEVDISAAVINLFAMHNRMHDFSYELGFTERRWNAQLNNFGNNTPGTLEGDPVIGNAQAGGLTGGASGTYLGRDNANMITLPDGVPPITNMYLWQPIAGAFYAPCVDGDYDMAIIGHEYGHMIENRMIGKGDGRSGHHAGAMGESFGDLVGMEIINEYDFAGASGENPFSLGGYATGNGERAIRNYNMSYPRTGGFPEEGSSTTGSGQWMGTQVNPLNFSNMGYDLTGPQVHADGEIWSATNFTIRQYLTTKYETSHPYSDVALQKECADGQRNPSDCPGNRRWMQIVFDAMLLMPTAPSMLEARDAYFAADMMRTGGENHPELWLAFAHRGFGAGADADNSVADPIPDFAVESASKCAGCADNATIKFEAVNEDGNPIAANIFVGHFENGTSKIADTDGNTSGADNLNNKADFAPGNYEFVAQANGFGHYRFAQDFAPGETKTITVKMAKNHASTSSGGQIVLGSSDGAQHGNLIDDTESTDWDKAADGIAIDVGQPHVTVDLGGMSAVTINRVQVSAMIVGSNRFTALRKFKVQTAVNPMTDLDFVDWIVSDDHAFPGHTPRPVSPEMILRSFDGPETTATHVRIVALQNQCTGNPDFQGELDADVSNPTDCTDTTIAPVTVPIFGEPTVLAPRHDEVHIAELQVFGAESAVECTSGCEVNQAPVAVDDSATTAQDTPTTINVLDGSASGGIADSDPDSDPLMVSAVQDPSDQGGAVTNNMNGTVTYTPAAGFFGTDTFTYTISDGNGGTDTGTVTVTVNQSGGGNNDPVAVDDSATTAQDTPTTINVLDGSASGGIADSDPDSDPLMVSAVQDPSDQGGAVTNNMNGTVTYTPAAGFFGTDTFTYTISDGNGGTDTGTVTVEVTEDPEPVNECAYDDDSDYHDCRVKGSGKLFDEDDADSDYDKFTIETKQKNGEVDGKLYFDTDGPMRKVRGTPNAQSINGSNATVWGTCEYESDSVAKQDCTFEVIVTEPDQFGIKIYDLNDGLLYEYNKQTISDGGIDVRSDEEYE